MTTFVFVLWGARGAATPPRPAAEPRDRAEAYYHFSLGLQARFSGDTQTSLDEYRKAQKLDPGSSAIRVETSRLLREAGKIDEALAEGREAVRLDKDSPDAHLTLAQLYQLQAAGAGGEESLRKAAAEYEDVVRLQPTHGNTPLTLAGIYGQQLQNNKEAARVWGLYLALDPGSFEAHIQLGTRLLAAGEPENAGAALKDALALQPGSARVYQILGDIYAQAEQTDEAVLHYGRALDVEPATLRVRLGLGEVLYRAGRCRGALDEGGAVLTSDARNRLALDLKGRTLRDQREFDRAEEVANALVAQDPSDLKSAYLKVTIAEGRRDFAAAASQLERILARNRTGQDGAESANNDRVFLVHLAKDLDQAVAETRGARSRFPDDADLAGLEATILREKGDTKGAADIVDRLREKSPKDPKVLAQVAVFYRRAKDFPRAESTLRQARELEPKSLGTLFQLGAVLERQQKHDEAVAVFREALLIEPNSAPILNYIGYMNADRNVRVQEAFEMIQRAVTLDPKNSAYLDSLGWALYRLGRFDAAEESVKKALAQQQKNAVILDHLR